MVVVDEVVLGAVGAVGFVVVTGTRGFATRL